MMQMSQLSTFWESSITLICMQIVKEEEEDKKTTIHSTIHSTTTETAERD